MEVIHLLGMAVVLQETQTPSRLSIVQFRASNGHLNVDPGVVEATVGALGTYHNEGLYEPQTLETPLTPKRVCELDLERGGKGFHKKALDRNLYELVGAGFRMFERTYHQMVHWPVAQIVASVARDLLIDNGVYGLSVVEHNTGGGGLTAALLHHRVGLLHTIDKDPKVLQTTRANFSRFNVPGWDQVQWHAMGAQEFNNEARLADRQFGLVVIDPPWDGILTPHNPFALMNGVEAAMELTSIARIIGFKLPGSIPEGEIFALGQALGRTTVLLRVNVFDHSKHYVEYFAFYVGEGKMDDKIVDRNYINFD